MASRSVCPKVGDLTRPLTETSAHASVCARLLSTAWRFFNRGIRRSLSVALLAFVLLWSYEAVAFADPNGTGGRCISSRGWDYVSNGTAGNFYVYDTPSGNWNVTTGHHVESMYLEDSPLNHRLELGIWWPKNEHDGAGNLVDYAELGYYFRFMSVYGTDFGPYTYGGPTSSGAWIPFAIYLNIGRYLFDANGTQVADIGFDFAGWSTYSDMAVDQGHTTGWDAYYGNNVGDLRGSCDYLKMMPTTSWTDWEYGKELWGYQGDPNRRYDFWPNKLGTSIHWGYCYWEQYA